MNFIKNIFHIQKIPVSAFNLLIVIFTLFLTLMINRSHRLFILIQVIIISFPAEFFLSFIFDEIEKGFLELKEIIIYGIISLVCFVLLSCTSWFAFISVATTFVKSKVPLSFKLINTKLHSTNFVSFLLNSIQGKTSFIALFVTLFLTLLPFYIALYHYLEFRNNDISAQSMIIRLYRYSLLLIVPFGVLFFITITE